MSANNFHLNITNEQGLTRYVSSSRPLVPTIFLPLLEDNPSHYHHDNVEGIKHHEPHGVVDIHITSPQEIEGPVGSEEVEDNIPQERTLSQRKRLGDGYRANDYCGHKYTSTLR